MSNKPSLALDKRWRDATQFVRCNCEHSLEIQEALEVQHYQYFPTHQREVQLCHVIFRCLTVDPRSPSLPGSPTSPFSPWGPIGPGSPPTPSVPLAPALPGSPGIPSLPLGPTVPVDKNKDSLGLYTLILTWHIHTWFPSVPITPITSIISLRARIPDLSSLALWSLIYSSINLIRLLVIG